MINFAENPVTIKTTEVNGYNIYTGVTITDNIDGTIEANMETVKTTGELKAEEGEYTVTYEVSDSSGNKTTLDRTFIVVVAEGPILGQSNAGSEVWTKDQSIEITAVDNDSNISSFSYKIIKDNVEGTIQNGTLDGKNASASIALSETGVYYIDYTAMDGYNNSTNTRIGPFKIDTTNPTLGSATPVGTMGSNGWYTSDITFTVKNGADAHSGHGSTVITPTSITGNTTGITVTMKTTDNVGNSVTGTVGIYKVDKTVPTITLKSTASETIVQGTSKAITDYFTVTSPTTYSGSTTVCKDGTGTSSPVVTNTSTLTEGTHTIRCTVTRGSGKTAYADKTITVYTEGWVVADQTSHSGSATVPGIANGLIPIKYRSASDQTTKWYDYDVQMWANAASVTEAYRNAAVGTKIPEEAVLAYFVWIPRYEYMYTNLGTSYAGGSKTAPGEIKINFIAKTKTTPSTNYKIHPAFTYDGEELDGIWVGKFETTGTAENPTIKPNLSSLRNQNVSTQFATAQKFSGGGSCTRPNSYGIDYAADAHMMKNSEWGAVAYLSQSKYGKYGKYPLTPYAQVGKNNSTNYLTGYGDSPYPNNVDTSTTGTIYGIYDMSGGADEYVMGYYTGASSTWGASSSGNKAGFSSAPNSKYYDAYTTTSITTACNGICYGHGLSETSGWYSNDATFISASIPWVVRGGRQGDSGAGIFSFNNYYNNGGGNGNFSFRVVIPNKHGIVCG